MNQIPMLIFDRKTLEEKTYWLERLAGGPVHCAARLDEPRREVYRGKSASVPLAISAELAAEIGQLTKGAFLTGTVLLAALMACLHKVGGHATVVVGTPSRKPETGCIGNAVAIVERLDPALTFRELLMRLRQTMLDAYAHQRYPHDRLAGDLGWTTAANRNPLFDVALVFDAIHDPLPDLPNDLTFHFSQTADGIAGRIDYNPDLYRADGMGLLARYVVHVLGQGVGDPAQVLGRMRLMPDEELRATLAAWNATDTPYPDRHNAFDPIAEQAARRPAAPALAYAGASLCYAELVGRVEAAAACLQERGVAPEQVVGICLRDPLHTVLALLAVLRAGGAFLPLDPDYPDERLAYMAGDSGAALLIADDGVGSRLGAPNAAILAPAELFAAGVAAPATAGPDSAAYVIYTSGSTGKPKGTLLRHRGLCNLARAQGRAFGIGPGSRVLQFASFSFDASVSEIFATLANGGTLHLATRAAMLPGAPLLGLLRAERISHVTLPPSLLAVLPEAELPDLATLIVAGEPCTAEIAAKWGAGRRFLNAYGPTEATVCATVGVWDGRGRPTIGRPIDNTRIHILDTAGKPVPPGVDGELHIESVGLAREYLNQPDLSAAKFVVGDGVRRYKSGDLARWLPNGEIEFLGRIDHQAKVRGFRVEPDDIAANLGAHPGVRHAAALVREDAPGEARIVAYAVPADGEASPAVLREFLRGRLPDYLLPAHIVLLAEFPLLPNGKVDRKALPAPEAVRAAGAKGGTPRDDLEFELAAIWADVLNQRTVGVHDDFFALGGHSLLAVRLMSRIQQAFARPLALDLLFGHTTVAALARELRREPRSAPWSPLVPLRPAGAGGQTPLFCVHPAGGRALCYMPLARALGDGQALYGLQARGFEAGQQPYADLAEMAADYRAAVKSTQAHGPYRLLGWSGGAVIAFEIARQLQAGGDEVALLALVDAYAPGSLPAHLAEQDDAELIKALLAEEVASVPLEELRGYSEEERLAYLAARLAEADVIPPDFGVAEVARFFAVYKTNCRLAHSELAAPFRGQIRLFRAEAEQALQQRYTPDDPTLGWAGLASGGVELAMVPGSHNGVMEAPQVEVLAGKLGV